jgi:hypothetical protein
MLTHAARRQTSTQEFADRGRLFAAPGVEIGAAQSAAGGKCAHPLAAGRANVGSGRSHANKQTASICVSDQGLLRVD